MNGVILTLNSIIKTGKVPVLLAPMAGVTDLPFRNAVSKFGVDMVFSEICLLYTSPSPRDRQKSRMPSSA